MKTGMTLIEMVVVLLLVALLVFSVTMAIVPASEAMLLTRQNVATAQKAQFALGRMVRECTAITNVVSGTTRSLVYDMVDETGTAQRRTLAWNDGGPLTLNGIPLSDDVASFQLQYFEAPGGTARNSWNPSVQLVEIALQSRNIPYRTFINRVYLRDP